ncbi:MAG: KEOPS complex subunit Pcc1 [Euryarchaeota archaeon]|nr:KEOPS complex subunit Pcc1 [Euryarchaeota archaeon]
MKIEAEFVLEDDEETVKTIYESIREEREDRVEDKRRSYVDLAIGANRLCVYIRGEDIVRVRAAANSWLRLLKVAEEMVEVVRECELRGS